MRQVTRQDSEHAAGSSGRVDQIYQIQLYLRACCRCFGFVPVVLQEMAEIVAARLLEQLARMEWMEQGEGLEPKLLQPMASV